MDVVGRRQSTDLEDAIRHIDEVREMLGADAILFLDFDGTLAPIVPHHADARLTVSVRSVLSSTAERMTVGIVSGRAAADVRDRVGLDELIYAGSHGLEIDLPDGERYEAPVPSDLSEVLDRLAADLGAQLSDLAGIYLERKPFGVVIHTREAPGEHERAGASSIVEGLTESYSGLQRRRGKEIIELMAATGWNKGAAIGYLQERFGRKVPMFIGDDQTDEDGFEMAQSLGGLGILVGPKPPRPTFARFTLENTDSVEKFLRLL